MVSDQISRPPRGSIGANVAAARAGLRKLDKDEKLTETDRPMVALLLSLAQELDLKPNNAQLVRQYRDTWLLLRGPRDVAPILALAARMRTEVGGPEESGSEVAREEGDLADEPDPRRRGDAVAGAGPDGGVRVGRARVSGLS